jgi:hypothetical protein
MSSEKSSSLVLTVGRCCTFRQQKRERERERERGREEEGGIVVIHVEK